MVIKNTLTINEIRDDYTVEVDWAGDLYAGIKLEWNYEAGYVDVSMPDYAQNKPIRYSHPPPAANSAHRMHRTRSSLERQPSHNIRTSPQLVGRVASQPHPVAGFHREGGGRSWAAFPKTIGYGAYGVRCLRLGGGCE